MSDEQAAPIETKPAESVEIPTKETPVEKKMKPKKKLPKKITKRIQYPIVLHKQTRADLRKLKNHPREYDDETVKRLIKFYKTNQPNIGDGK